MSYLSLIFLGSLTAWSWMFAGSSVSLLSRRELWASKPLSDFQEGSIFMIIWIATHNFELLPIFWWLLWSIYFFLLSIKSTLIGLSQLRQFIYENVLLFFLFHALKTKLISKSVSINSHFPWLVSKRNQHMRLFTKFMTNF